MSMAAGGSARARRFDAGRVCLDLVATEGVGARGPGELLGGADRLARWLREVRLVPPDTELSAVDGEWVARFRELRSDVRVAMDTQLNGAAGPSDALDRLNALAAGPPPSPRAVRGADGSLGTDPVLRARLRGPPRRRRPGRGGPAHRSRRAGRPCAAARATCSPPLPGHLARPPAALVLRRRLRQPRPGRPPPPQKPGGAGGPGRGGGAGCPGRVDSPGPPAGGGPGTPAADRAIPAGGSPETPAADRDPPVGEGPGRPRPHRPHQHRPRRRSPAHPRRRRPGEPPAEKIRPALDGRCARLPPFA
ncbi:hypothetical protein SCALM49S_08733 [Streptomyces californicus]